MVLLEIMSVKALFVDDPNYGWTNSILSVVSYHLMRNTHL
jgi:hypothetical protein